MSLGSGVVCNLVGVYAASLVIALLKCVSDQLVIHVIYKYFWFVVCYILLVKLIRIESFSIIFILIPCPISSSTGLECTNVSLLYETRDWCIKLSTWYLCYLRTHWNVNIFCRFAFTVNLLFQKLLLYQM